MKALSKKQQQNLHPATKRIRTYEDAIRFVSDPVDKKSVSPMLINVVALVIGNLVLLTLIAGIFALIIMHHTK